MRLREIIQEAQQKVGTFYYSPRTDKLPEDMVKLFTKLARQQRTGPEVTMQRITTKYPLMWYGSLLEHMGDLIHATSDCVNYDGVIVRDVERKLQSASHTLSNLRANLEELSAENAIQAERKGISHEQYVKEIIHSSQKYVMEHYKLPSYNEIHLLCKKITVTLGAMEFEECAKHVNEMLRYAKDGSLNKRALTITRNRQGNIVEL